MDAYDEKSANFQETKRHFGTFLADEVRGGHREKGKERRPLGDGMDGRASASPLTAVAACVCLLVAVGLCVGGWRVPAARGGHAQEQRGERNRGTAGAAEAERRSAAHRDREPLCSPADPSPAAPSRCDCPQTRLVVNIDDIRKYDRQMADK